MITSLSILSSIAIIVTALVAYFEYLAGKRRHKQLLAIDSLRKQKDDFVSWFYEYLHLTEVLTRLAIQLNMDTLEQIYQRTENPEELAIRSHREARITENLPRRDRYEADLNFQMMLLNLVVDERKPFFASAQEKIRENHDLIEKKMDAFAHQLYTGLDDRMRQATSKEEAASVMAEARQLARELKKTLTESNHAMGEQVKADIHLLEDEIELNFRR